MIYCEDSLSFVEDLGDFDYIITDPPYSNWSKSRMVTGKKSVIGAMEMARGMQLSF